MVRPQISITNRDDKVKTMSDVSHTAILKPGLSVASVVSTQMAIGLIRFYQRWISPIKGFRCAHRALHGGDSCSEAILKLVQARGVWSCLPDVRHRFRECALAARVYRLKLAMATVDESPAGGDPPTDRNEVPTAVHLACGSGMECCGIVGLEGCCSLLT